MLWHSAILNLVELEQKGTKQNVHVPESRSSLHTKWNTREAVTREILKMDGKKSIQFELLVTRTVLIIASSVFVVNRMEGQAEYHLPASLETKYVGEMKDGM